MWRNVLITCDLRLMDSAQPTDDNPKFRPPNRPSGLAKGNQIRPTDSLNLLDFCVSV